jgi:hypothetical protein
MQGIDLDTIVGAWNGVRIELLTFLSHQTRQRLEEGKEVFVRQHQQSSVA